MSLCTRHSKQKHLECTAVLSSWTRWPLLSIERTHLLFPGWELPFVTGPCHLPSSLPLGYPFRQLELLTSIQSRSFQYMRTKRTLLTLFPDYNNPNSLLAYLSLSLSLALSLPPLSSSPTQELQIIFFSSIITLMLFDVVKTDMGANTHIKVLKAVPLRSLSWWAPSCSPFFQFPIHKPSGFRPLPSTFPPSTCSTSKNPLTTHSSVAKTAATIPASCPLP